MFEGFLYESEKHKEVCLDDKNHSHFSFERKNDKVTWNPEGPAKLLKHISKSFSKSLGIPFDEPSVVSKESGEDYYVLLKELGKPSSVKNENDIPGTLAHSKGPPSSTKNRLVLHVGTLTLEGLKKTPMRRRDLKVLKRIDENIREIVLETFRNVSVFDYEFNCKETSKVYSPMFGVSSVSWLGESVKVRFDSFVKSLSKKKKINLLKSTNDSLRPYGVYARLVKREEKLIGTTATVYYLLVMSKRWGEELPVQSS